MICSCSFLVTDEFPSGLSKIRDLKKKKREKKNSKEQSDPHYSFNRACIIEHVSKFNFSRTS